MRHIRFSNKTMVILLIGLMSFGILSQCSRSYNPEKRAQRMADMLTDELDLDDKQSQHLNKIKEEILAKGKEYRKHRRVIKDEILAQINSDAVSEDKLNSVFEQQEPYRKEMRKFMISKFAEFHKTLKPEQRTKLAELVEKFSKRFEQE